MFKNRPIYWVIAISIALFVVLMWLSPQKDELQSSQLPWNAAYDEQDRLHALGLTLMHSTLQDAMKLYGRDVEVKLFEMPNGERSAEGYFNSAYIGSIHGALVIKLAMNEQELNQYFDRGARITVSKQGSREVQLNNEDTLALFNYPIKELTLVPRRRLNSQAIEKRFGTPDQIIYDEQEDLSTWFYEALGLELIIIEGGNDILRYQARR